MQMEVRDSEADESLSRNYYPFGPNWQPFWIKLVAPPTHYQKHVFSNGNFFYATFFFQNFCG